MEKLFGQDADPVAELQTPVVSDEQALTAGDVVVRPRYKLNHSGDGREISLRDDDTGEVEIIHLER